MIPDPAPRRNAVVQCEQLGVVESRSLSYDKVTEKASSMESVTIKVLYFGQIKEAVSVTEESVELAEGASVRDLISVLGERHGPAFRETLFSSEDSLVPNAIILLDGANILHRDGMETRIERDGLTHILLMTSAVGGG